MRVSTEPEGSGDSRWQARSDIRPNLQFAAVPASGPLLVMAALIIFALPITDTTLAIVRRKMRGQPLFSPDNQHLHHQLIRSGLGVKRAVLTLYLIAAFFAVLGCSLAFLQWRFVIAFFVVLFGFIVVTAYKAGHRQALAAKLAEPAPGGGAAVAPAPALDLPSGRVIAAAAEASKA